MYTEFPVDGKMRELTRHGTDDFPIQYYVDELHRFSGHTIPLHWHPELEIWKAEGGNVTVQVGAETLLLEEGSAIFINANTLHGFTLPDETRTPACPNIVFKGELAAPVTSMIYKKYIAPILSDPCIPYILLQPSYAWQANILEHLEQIFFLMKTPAAPCPELGVQRELGWIWQLLWTNREQIPLSEGKKNERLLQVRIQKMLTFIHSSCPSRITLADIAASAGISKSEAARCFQACLLTSPVNYLLSLRIETARHALAASRDTVEEISASCGFQSASYFCRVFRKYTGMTPLQYRKEKNRLL